MTSRKLPVGMASASSKHNTMVGSGLVSVPAKTAVPTLAGGTSSHQANVRSSWSTQSFSSDVSIFILLPTIMFSQIVTLWQSKCCITNRYIYYCHIFQSGGDECAICMYGMSLSASLTLECQHTFHKNVSNIQILVNSASHMFIDTPACYK